MSGGRDAWSERESDSAWDEDDRQDPTVLFERAMEEGKIVLEYIGDGDGSTQVSRWNEQFWVRTECDDHGPYASLPEALRECGMHEDYEPTFEHRFTCKSLKQSIVVALLDSIAERKHAVRREALVHVNDKPYIVSAGGFLRPWSADRHEERLGYRLWARLGDGIYLAAEPSDGEDGWAEPRGEDHPLVHRVSAKRIIKRLECREDAEAFRALARKFQDEQLLEALRPLLAKAGGLRSEDDGEEDDS